MQSKQMQSTWDDASNTLDPLSPIDENGVTLRLRSDDCFLDYYFRRVDPRIAASFTEEQRQAIKTMFDGRSVRRHPLDVRRTVGFGKYRFYFVVLGGRERRLLPKSKPVGLLSNLSSFLGYLALTGGLLAAIATFVYQIKG